MTLFRGATALLLLAVAACSTPSDIATGPQPVLVADGILAEGTGQVISFGRARAGAVDAATKLVGAPPSGTRTLSECGAGPVQAVSYPGGLTLNFTGGGFSGWVAKSGSRSWRGPGPLRTGMSRNEVAALPGASFRQTSLGNEVEVGNVFGIIGDDGTLDVMFAGTTCFAR